MRNLKFRAWDIKRKTYEHEELLLAPNGDILASRWQELCEPESEYIIEQYTGVKDKNGKEVYEGDILVSNYSTVYKVSYSEPNGRFEMWGEDGRGGSIADDQYTEDFEINVIGNIHENPELSEKQNDQPLSWEFQNNHGHIGGVDIYAKNKELLVWVDDCYYNFCIPFDKFLEIAEKVRGMENAED